MRSTTSLLAAFAVTCLFAFTRCGSHPFNGGDASADGATDSPQLQDVIFNPQDGANCGTTPATCSGDGHAITLNGVTYAKGLGTHAVSQIVYTIGGQYSTFASDVGIDDEDDTALACAQRSRRFAKSHHALRPLARSPTTRERNFSIAKGFSRKSSAPQAMI